MHTPRRDGRRSGRRRFCCCHSFRPASAARRLWRALPCGALARAGLLLPDVHPGGPVCLFHARVRDRPWPPGDGRRPGVVRDGGRRRRPRRGDQGNIGHRAPGCTRGLRDRVVVAGTATAAIALPAGDWRRRPSSACRRRRRSRRSSTRRFSPIRAESWRRSGRPARISTAASTPGATRTRGTSTSACSPTRRRGA